MLHFKTHFLKGWKSAVDGPGFFLSPNGQKDPLAELQATIAALEKGGGSFGKLQQPIGCALPLRKAFLEKKLERTFPSDDCKDFNEFHARLDPAGVAMVFATSYPGNPASMFGHSFLKILSAKNREKNLGILDWSVNYAAMVPEDENAFAFAYFGLTGGYAGQFATVPYYKKIEEYGYLEGRDIWEYELNLTPEQQELLLKAIWEIETNSHFDYFFFDENCSYQILALLEVVRPDWEISGYFIHMIPGESVKVVAHVPGAIKEVRMRPSLERRLMASVADLTKEEKRDFYAAKRGEAIAGLDAKSLRAYLFYLQAEKKRLEDKWKAEPRLREVLLRSAQLPPVAPLENLGGEKTRPDLSHGAYQIGLGAFTRSGGERGEELSLRFAYHSLLDPDPGYMPHSEILFPNFRFRYSHPRKKFFLEEAQGFSLVSLTPWNLVRRPLAWRTRLSYQTLMGDACNSCKGLHGEAGVGSAWALAPGKFTLWAMLGGQTEFYTSLFARPWLELGALFTLPGEGKILLEARTMRGRGSWQEKFHFGFSQPISPSWLGKIEGEAILPWEKEKKSVGDLRILALRYF